MEEDEIKPNKRPRVGSSLEELQQVIKSKDMAIEEMNSKLNAATAEIAKLRKMIEELIGSAQSSSCRMDDATSEGDTMAEESTPVEIKKKKKRRKVRVIPNEELKKNYADAAEVCGSKNEGTVDGKAAVNNQADAPSCSEGGTRKAEQSKSKIPVITAYNINVKDMTSIIDRTLGHGNYNVKILGKNATNFGACTLADFEKLKVLLKDQGVNYYTYTPKGIRPFSVVIEGLSGTYSTDDVMEYLGGLQIRMNIVGLSNLGGDRWLLRLSRDSDVSSFYGVRYILRCRVSMRKYRKKMLTQCFNCQRFGHVSANCQMQYRCVKCSGSHGPGKCDIPPRSENTKENSTTDPITGQAVRKVGLPVRCANCDVEGHAASSRDCPRRIEILRKLEAKRESRGEPGRLGRPAGSSLRNGMSYASAVASNLPVRGPAITARTSTTVEPSLKGAMAHLEPIDKDCKRFFGGGLISCLDKIGGFAREYRTLKDDGSKSLALLGMLMMLRQDG